MAQLPAGRPAAPSSAAAQQLASPAAGVTLLSYNVWFEDVAFEQRMAAIGNIIQQAGSPDFVLLQEVTPDMVKLWQQCAWWRGYHCSPLPAGAPYFTLLLARRDTVTLPAFTPWASLPYANSVMGRGILYTCASLAGGRPLVVGTTHLESPTGRDQLFVQERRVQLEAAVRQLEAAAAGRGADIILAGDLNWKEQRDGALPLPPSWRDAWLQLHPGQPGLTYDPQSNPMIGSTWGGGAGAGRRAQPGWRFDRVLCRLAAQQLQSLSMVGKQTLPGVFFSRGGDSATRLPVLPSDHFGLLVKLMPAPGRALGGADGASAAAAAAAAAPPPALVAGGRHHASAVGNGTGHPLLRGQLQQQHGPAQGAVLAPMPNGTEPAPGSAACLSPAAAGAAGVGVRLHHHRGEQRQSGASPSKRAQQRAGLDAGDDGDDVIVL